MTDSTGARTTAARTVDARTVDAHGGHLALEVAQGFGVDILFTLSGAHVFPLYDAAVKPTEGKDAVRLVDVRHEQTAVFAAEATAKLTRRPGLAVLTAGPGVTNGVSGMATAWFNGSPVLVLGGRAPGFRWGTGSLQELDHPPLVAPVTKHAGTVASVADVPARVDEALRLATSPHRGPVFLDVPMDQLYSSARVQMPEAPGRVRLDPDPEALDRVGKLVAEATRPVLVLGSDVWADGAEQSARRAAETMGVPVIANGMGRGVVPAGHDLLVTRARSAAFGRADLVIVVGAPLDFRLGYGVFGGKEGADPARVVHLADSPDQLAAHVDLAASASGDLTAVLDGAAAAYTAAESRRDPFATWRSDLRGHADSAMAADAGLLASDSDPVHPARIYGELVRRLEDDAVVIGDGGDFVSFAGRFVEPRRPGGWLDPGPYGCLGTGPGYAAGARLAHPSSQVVLLLGDGAAGFSLADLDTLVRHQLPAVVVCGNNGAWGLEKHPMRFLYGYDVVADLAPGTRYDEVMRALGGEGETVTRPGDVGPALDRAFASGAPYLVNVVTDPEVAYPRSTTGV